MPIGEFKEYHLVTFDPGGRIGWAYFAVKREAFMQPRAKLLPNIIEWHTGEFRDTEYYNLDRCAALMKRARWDNEGRVFETGVVVEDFELTQMTGGDNLLSPVRQIAVIQWEAKRRCGLSVGTLAYPDGFFKQKRQLRLGVTRERLKEWGFSSKGKDSFAAMQHGITWLRRIKLEANKRPWPKRER